MSSSIHAEPPPPIVTEPNGGINYATGPALGKGGFAICHRAERYEGSKPTGQLLALKIVKTKMEPAKLAQKFVSELQIHSKLVHPNIVAFYRAFAFQTSTYVVLELCPNGSLADMLKKRKFLTLPEIRRFVIQICGAVKYLHHRHIVHRDLKTGNLFLDKDMNVKVGDFGLAALLVTEKEMELKRRTTMCGTPNYLAPEILEKGKGHNEKVDLWSIGVIAYTLAVGKAPFHASTKEEIYKKLKQGEYKWPELSATNNDISNDLRVTVASLLVPEDMRPSPDEIVSQDFFKIAYVPAGIPSSAREKAPVWMEATVPSKSVREQGYSDSWRALCEEAGVGSIREGSKFKLPGGARVRSIVYDIEYDAQMGTTPTMPIPKDTVYVSTVSDMSKDSTPEPELASRPPSRGLKEISHNEVAARARPAVADRDAMPPPSRPARTAEVAARPASRAARTGTIRRTARTISEETANAEEKVKVASDPDMAWPASRQRGQTLAAPTALRVAESSGLTARQQAAQVAETDAALLKPARAASTRTRGADPSLARRPGATSRRVDRSVSPPVAQPFATLEELRQVSPFKESRRRAPPAEVIEILSDPESDAHAPIRQTIQSALNTNVLSLPPPPRMARTVPRPRKVTPAAVPMNPNALPSSNPASVLTRLTLFRDNLAAALTNSTTSPPRPDPVDADSLPFVVKWVDYSHKHGVGYMLRSGTVGCVFNASNRHSAPVTHVFSHCGRKWLAKVRKDLDNAEEIPLEILEDKGDDGLVRKIYKGLGSVKEGPLAAEQARRKTLGVLWAKFGRYMGQSLEGEVGEEAVSKDGSMKEANFVRFYQRVGTVGIWVFNDGCMQLHFPDHTKLVLSPSGLHLSTTLLSPEAATYLSAHSTLLPHHISGRETLASTTQSLLHEGGRVQTRTVRANQVREKLEFLSRVVTEWVECGGLGRMRADDGSGEKVHWEGLCAGGQGKKVERGTVGRCGGDVSR
ncbi:hypothetical protein B0A48_14309 [Cryoendolithus antarcticus]|uniref:Protein kinase domain-containing protein n=1 Tax=Cryoendolithus antarcticus TaxID=1507870 RepID=A0A1V8SJL5_9PEZI|nr:hypothetical protein B0A48_14309 [Cryoendolithus antarcticus]